MQDTGGQLKNPKQSLMSRWRSVEVNRVRMGQVFNRVHKAGKTVIYEEFIKEHERKKKKK